RAARGRGLLDDDGQLDLARPAAAVLLRQVHPEEAGLAHRGPQLVAGAARLDLGDVVLGAELVGDGPHGLAQRAMLVGLLKIHAVLHCRGAPLVHHDSLRTSGARPKESTVAQERIRRRDPERGTRILEASAELFASRGYHAVGMAEIG